MYARLTIATVVAECSANGHLMGEKERDDSVTMATWFDLINCLSVFTPFSDSFALNIHHRYCGIDCTWREHVCSLVWLFYLYVKQVHTCLESTCCSVNWLEWFVAAWLSFIRSSSGTIVSLCSTDAHLRDGYHDYCMRIVRSRTRTLLLTISHVNSIPSANT